jgi:hypothetical protein
MKPSVLIQLDGDPRPSAFDAIVAIDAGVDRLLPYGGVTPDAVTEIVHGAIFTRGGADLARTALFVGGSDVAQAEKLVRAIEKTFFGPFRVSMLVDPSGSNTTAAAAVLSAESSFSGALRDVNAAVLGATGPVGQRVVRLLSRGGALVSAGSRSIERAERVAHQVESLTGRRIAAFTTADPSKLAEVLKPAELIIAAGAAGVMLLPASLIARLPALKVAIDLNAVPPAGIETIQPPDRATLREGVTCWGALGVGSTKMKIHKRAIQALFDRNDQVLEAESLLELGRTLTSS